MGTVRRGPEEVVLNRKKGAKGVVRWDSTATGLMGGKFFKMTGQAGRKTEMGGLEGAVAGSEKPARAARGVQRMM